MTSVTLSSPQGWGTEPLLPPSSARVLGPRPRARAAEADSEVGSQLPEQRRLSRPQSSLLGGVLNWTLFFLLLFYTMLLSAHIERVSVSRMRNFLSSFPLKWPYYGKYGPETAVAALRGPAVGCH